MNTMIVNISHRVIDEYGINRLKYKGSTEFTVRNNIIFGLVFIVLPITSIVRNILEINSKND